MIYFKLAFYSKIIRYRTVPNYQTAPIPQPNFYPPAPIPQQSFLNVPNAPPAFNPEVESQRSPNQVHGHQQYIQQQQYVPYQQQYVPYQNAQYPPSPMPVAVPVMAGAGIAYAASGYHTVGVPGPIITQGGYCSGGDSDSDCCDD